MPCGGSEIDAPGGGNGKGPNSATTFRPQRFWPVAVIVHNWQGTRIVHEPPPSAIFAGTRALYPRIRIVSPAAPSVLPACVPSARKNGLGGHADVVRIGEVDPDRAPAALEVAEPELEPVRVDVDAVAAVCV